MSVTEQSQLARKAHPAWGWLLIAIGAFPLLIATGLLDPGNAEVNAPMWVLGLCGVLFMLCGLMIWVGRQNRWNNLLAALVLGCFGAMGAWVALGSPPGSIEGGIPFAPQAFNQALGRWVFGIGAAISLLLALYALRQFIGGSRD